MRIVVRKGVCQRGRSFPGRRLRVGSDRWQARELRLRGSTSDNAEARGIRRRLRSAVFELIVERHGYRQRRKPTRTTPTPNRRVDPQRYNDHPAHHGRRAL